MVDDNAVIRFNNVFFSYGTQKVILDGASFSVRKNSIVTIIGQNGAGKSTIFNLILGKLNPQGGRINLENNITVGIAEQMIPTNKLTMDIVTYFKTGVKTPKPGIEGAIVKSLKAVNLDIPLTKKANELSGGEKARLLLAHALFSNPDVLLLDEPTNNLDDKGIEHLTSFLMNYEKTCIVISHDADFLNSFTNGVLNLDNHIHKVEQYVGNYYDALDEIAAKLERDKLLNSRVARSIKDRYLKVNKLGGKSVQMSQLARRIRKDIEDDKEDIVELRQEDKPIADFIIPCQEFVGSVIKINKPIVTELNKNMRLLIKGPNGIGKSTLLRSILAGESADINPRIRVGYYSQDFTELNLNQTAYESLYEVAVEKRDQAIYATASKFLLHSSILKNKIETLSDGQKGLLCYARFTLQQPGILILDEPTNHINFRHIPVIAKAVNNYIGPVILVSHLPDFVTQIENVSDLELGI